MYCRIPMHLRVDYIALWCYSRNILLIHSLDSLCVKEQPNSVNTSIMIRCNWMSITLMLLPIVTVNLRVLPCP